MEELILSLPLSSFWAGDPVAWAVVEDDEPEATEEVPLAVEVAVAPASVEVATIGELFNAKVEVEAAPEVANGTSPAVPLDWIKMTSV